MHTLKIDGVTFIYDGGYDGDVLIRNEYARVCVPFSAIKQLVAAHARTERVAALEQASDDDILGITKP